MTIKLPTGKIIELDKSEWIYLISFINDAQTNSTKPSGEYKGPRNMIFKEEK